MKIGFWNINRNESVDKIVAEYAITNCIDFLVLFESKFNPVDFLLKLNLKKTKFYYYKSNAASWLQIFTTFSNTLLEDVCDDFRITGKEFSSPLGEKINMIFLHFPSKLNFDEADQDAQAAEVKLFIDEMEFRTGHENTIVIGDFNMNPFQKGMIQTTGLHSTFDKAIALQENRIVKDKTYKYFYNPMWSFYGDYGKGVVNGSYYLRSSKPICYFWNIFDQVLLRPYFIDLKFDESSLRIVESFGSINLLKKNGVINQKISDHLPIEFDLNI